MKTTIQDQITQYCACLQEWNASYEEYAKSVGLSYTSLQILNTIYDTENCTQKILCEVCFLPKQTVNAVVTAFYKSGWIRLEELSEDRRTKTIHFTDEGAKSAEKIMLKVKDSERKAMGQLTEEQRETLIAVTKSYITCCRNAMQE